MAFALVQLQASTPRKFLPEVQPDTGHCFAAWEYTKGEQNTEVVGLPEGFGFRSLDSFPFAGKPCASRDTSHRRVCRLGSRLAFGNTDLTLQR